MTAEPSRLTPEERVPTPRKPGRPPLRRASDPVPGWEEYTPTVLGRGLIEGISISKGGILISAPLAAHIAGPRIRIMVNRSKAQVGLIGSTESGYTATRGTGGSIMINCKGAIKSLGLKKGRYPGATWRTEISMVVIEKALAP